MNKHEVKYQRTNNRMCEALIVILKKKRVEEISVSEICEAAEVNRTTFYSHFDTVTDLLNDCKKYIIALCKSYVKEKYDDAEFSAKMDSFDEEFIRKVYLYPYLEVIKEYREIFEIPEFSHLSEMFQSNSQHMMENLFAQGYKRAGVLGKTSVDYSATFLFAGVDAVVGKWLKSGCKESVEQIGDIIRNCIIPTKNI